MSIEAQKARLRRQANADEQTAKAEHSQTKRPFTRTGDGLLLNVPLSNDTRLLSSAAAIFAGAVLALCVLFFAGLGSTLALAANVSLLAVLGGMLALALGAAVLGIGAGVGGWVVLRAMGRRQIQNKQIRSWRLGGFRDVRRITVTGVPGDSVDIDADGHLWFNLTPTPDGDDWTKAALDEFVETVHDMGIAVDDRRDPDAWHQWATDPSTRTYYELQAHLGRTEQQFPMFFQVAPAPLPVESSLDGLTYQTPLFVQHLFEQVPVPLRVDAKTIAFGDVEFARDRIQAIGPVLRRGQNAVLAEISLLADGQIHKFGQAFIRPGDPDQVMARLLGLCEVVREAAAMPTPVQGSSADVPEDLGRLVGTVDATEGP